MFLDEDKQACQSQGVMHLHEANWPTEQHLSKQRPQYLSI